MRFWSLFNFGTQGYPEPVARRLRLVNLICWMSAAFLYSIAVRRFLDPSTFRWGIEATFVGTMLASIPLLHRLSSAAALIALIVLVYLDTWRVSLDGGTGGGYWLTMFGGSALSILVLGAERPILSSLLAMTALVTTLLMQIEIPFNTGDQTPADQFTSLLINIGRTHILLFGVVSFGAWQIARAEQEAERERNHSDVLLKNILPPAIADRLRANPKSKIADRYEEASVLFADMAGFTAKAGAVSPEQLVSMLDRIYSAFDALVERHAVEKIKTSGDAYMAVSGVPVARADHAIVLVRLGRDMLRAAEAEGVSIRIGIASGPVVAGVVGTKKFFYDVWGDTVNIAARMEQTGEEGRIQMTAATAELLRGEVSLEEPRVTMVKGKGEISTLFASERE